MRKINGLALALGLILLASAGASAQSVPDTRIPLPGITRQENQWDQSNDAIRVMNRFARCAGWRRQRQAEEALALPLRSPEQSAAVRRIVNRDLEEDCFREGEEGRLGFGPSLLVGGMAEELILRRYRNADPAAIAALPPDVQAQIGLRPRNGPEDLALCIVQRDPAGVRALIDTEPTSSAENAAITRLIPHVTACVPAGQTMEFSRPALRGLVAAGLYRTLSLMAAQRR